MSDFHTADYILNFSLPLPTFSWRSTPRSYRILMYFEMVGCSKDSLSAVWVDVDPSVSAKCNIISRDHFCWSKGVRFFLSALSFPDMK